MKSKTTFFSATAAIAFAATISASPAQALSIAPGSALNFGGDVKILPDNTNPTQLQFIGPTRIGVSESGSFAGLANTTASIQNLTLTSIAGGLFESGSVVNFITGIGPGAISLDLTNFIYNPANSSATFSGLFKSGSDSIAASGGLFTSQLNVANPTTYSATVATVPTPALLPGLIGVGVAVWRKRKGESAEQAET